MSKLFAIDEKKEEVIVSESPSGSKKIHFLERISRKENEALYAAVIKLTELARSVDMDLKELKAADKQCQLIYRNFGANR